MMANQETIQVVILSVWTVVFLVGAVLSEFVMLPLERDCFLADLDISYPTHESLVGIVALVLISALPTIFFLGIFTPMVGNWRVFGILLLNFILGACVTITTTDTIKNVTGRLRPDFLSRCEVDTSKIVSQNVSSLPIAYTGSICTGDADEIADGRRSFPSGHSSLSAFGCLYLAFLLHRIISKHILSRSLVQVILFTSAALVAASRVADNHHHLSDILAGNILGTALAAFFVFIALDEEILQEMWIYQRKSDVHTHEDLHVGEV